MYFYISTSASQRVQLEIVICDMKVILKKREATLNGGQIFKEIALTLLKDMFQIKIKS